MTTGHTIRCSSGYAKLLRSAVRDAIRYHEALTELLDQEDLGVRLSASRVRIYRQLLKTIPKVRRG